MENQDLISAIEAYLAKNGKGNSYLVKKITDLFENADSPLNLRSGALKNLKKSIETFETKMLGVNKNLDKFSDKLKYAVSQIKIPKLTQLSNASDKFSNSLTAFSKNIKTIKLPQSKSGMFPSTTAFARELNSSTNKLKNFRTKFKANLLESFFNNLKMLNTSLKKANKLFGTTGIESSTSSRSVYDVRVVDLSSGVKSLLLKNIKQNTTNIVQQQNNTNSSREAGSFIGNIIKNLLGGVALLAGIGFVSKYLENNPMAKMMFSNITKNALEALGKLKTEIFKIFGPIVKTIGEYAWEGAKLLLKQIPKLFSATFNFFGLKEELGEGNEGIAVIITKGIYYSVKKVLLGILNKSTFGMFGSGMNLLRPQLDKLATSFLNNGMFDTLKKVFAKISNSIKGIFSPLFNAFGAIIKPITTMLSPVLTSLKTMGAKIVNSVLSPLKSIGAKVMNSVSGLFKPLINIFSGVSTGPVGKFIGTVGKTFSKVLGTAFTKLLGGGLKVIAKRIPLVGTLISFKDAYDRFKNGDILGGLISVGSGIATIFPGIGTAISIGLDVLNAILDSKSASDGKGKGQILMDFASPMLEKITDSIGGFLKGIWDTITGILSAATKFVTDKANEIYDTVFGKADTFVESVGFSANRKTSPEDQEEIAALRANAAKIKAERAANNITSNTLAPPKHIKDGEIIIPDKKDAHIFAKEDGPFNKNLTEMNNKMSALISVFAEGVQMIANTTSQGSSSIVNAVVSSGSNDSSSVLAGSVDPIGEYRLRAARAIEYVSR